MRALLIACFALVVALGAMPRGASAQTSIVAVVNGAPITSYDLSQRQKLLRLTGAKGNTRSIALEELIDERVQLGAAKQVNITPSDEDVTRAIGELAKRVKLSPSQLRAALGQQGINMRTLEDRIRAQIAFSQLVRARFNQSAGVTEQDLVAALLKDEAKENTIEAARYELERVTIALPENPSARRLNSAKSRAADLRQRFTSCRSGIEMAKKTRNVVVQPFGTRLQSDLSTDAREALKDVPVGRLSPPIETPRGLVMFAVCDKTTVRSTNAAMKELEEDMRTEKGAQFQRQYSRQLRRDAVIERY